MCHYHQNKELVLAQQHNNINFINLKEQQDENDKAIKSIKLLNNIVIKLQNKISNMQTDNDIDMHKRRLDAMQDIVIINDVLYLCCRIFYSSMI